MKKQLIALSILGVILTGCSSSAQAATHQTPVAIVKTNQTIMQTVYAQARAHQVALVIGELKRQVGRTWYVFSGATPSGWDCSGLTMWAYEQLGVELPHSANKQARVGISVVSPQPGDLVLFGYKGTNTYFHASIYIGDNKVIHAGFKPGQRTAILDLSSASVKNTKMKFVRVNLNG